VLTACLCALIASTFAFPSSASLNYTSRGPLWVAGFWGQRMVRQLFQTPTGSRQAMQTIRPALTTTRCSMRRVWSGHREAAMHYLRREQTFLQGKCGLFDAAWPVPAQAASERVQGGYGDSISQHADCNDSRSDGDRYPVAVSLR